MRPLRDSIGDRDPETAREARLLRAVAPLSPSLARMHRVRLRIEAEPQRAWYALSPRALLAAGALTAALLLVMQQRLQSATVAAQVEAEAAVHHASPAAPPLPAAPAETASPALALPSTAAAAPDARPLAGAALAPASPDTTLARGSTVVTPTAATPLGHEAIPAADGTAPAAPSAGRSATAAPTQLAGATAPLLLAPAGANREALANPAAGPVNVNGNVDGTGATAAGAPAPAQGIALGASPSVPGGAVAALPGSSSNGTSPAPAPPAPRGPGVPREMAGGGHGNPRFEPALISQAATEAPRQEVVAVAYAGLLDGERVSGTVALRRADDGGHSLVIRRGEEVIAEAHLLESPVADLVVDIDGDGLDDMQISLRPPQSETEGELSARDTAAFVPDVGVMLRAAP